MRGKIDRGTVSGDRPPNGMIWPGSGLLKNELL